MDTILRKFPQAAYMKFHPSGTMVFVYGDYIERELPVDVATDIVAYWYARIRKEAIPYGREKDDIPISQRHTRKERGISSNRKQTPQTIQVRPMAQA